MSNFTTKALANPTVNEGSISSGSYSDTLVSNDTRLVVADSGGSPSLKYKLDLEFDGVAPSAQWEDAIGVNESGIQSIQITLEAKDSVSTDDYYLLMWNFNSSAWDEVGAVMSIGTTEETFTRDITANYDDYVSSDEMKVRIANGKALGKGGAPNNNGVLEIDYFDVVLVNSSEKIVTANGNVEIDTAQEKFGGASGLFPGANGDVLTTPDDADWHFGSGDFTLEGFVRFSSLSTGAQILFHQFNSGNRGWSVYFVDSANELHFGYSTNGSTAIDNARSWSPNINTWYHWAICRSGNNIRYFIDGTQLGANLDVTGANFFNSTDPLGIGGKSIGTKADTVAGWMDEMRIKKGTALYTSNFSAPTAQFTFESDNVLLLHMNGDDESTTFTDSSADTSDVGPPVTGAKLLNLLGVGA